MSRRVRVLQNVKIFSTWFSFFCLESPGARVDRNVMLNEAGDSVEVFEFHAPMFVNEQTVVNRICHIIAEVGTFDIELEVAFQIKNFWIGVILEIRNGVVPFLIVADDAIET